MKFYYTAAKSYLGEQQDPLLSLGSFVSKSLIPNAYIGALFASISLSLIDQIEEQYSDMIGIVLKNELGYDVEDIILYFTYPTNCYIKYKVGFVALNGSAINAFYMPETLVNNKSTLYTNVEFYEPTNIAPINIGDLENGAYIGIWIKRELLITIKDTFTDDYLYGLVIAGETQELNKVESVIMELSCTDILTTTPAPTTTVVTTTIVSTTTEVPTTTL